MDAHKEGLSLVLSADEVKVPGLCNQGGHVRWVFGQGGIERRERRLQTAREAQHHGENILAMSDPLGISGPSPPTNHRHRRSSVIDRLVYLSQPFVRARRELVPDEAHLLDEVLGSLVLRVLQHPSVESLVEAPLEAVHGGQQFLVVLEEGLVVRELDEGSKPDHQVFGSREWAHELGRLGQHSATS
jgi:hypothetical protein